MKYFKSKKTGEVFAYENEQERQEWGAPELVEMTPEEVEVHLNPPPVPLTLEQIRELRRRAYIAESDPLRNAADYDALVNGTKPDYTEWLAAVAAIKARYPLPETGHGADPR